MQTIRYQVQERRTGEVVATYKSPVTAEKALTNLNTGLIHTVVPVGRAGQSLIPR